MCLFIFFSTSLNRCRGKKLLAVLDRLQPLEDIMSKNDAYVALRQHVGAPAPSSEESMQLKVKQIQRIISLC